MKKGYWLVTTEHLVDRLWFKDEEDFKVGMNYVALLAARLQVKVLAFILMSNHIHFILYCTESEAIGFINRFKKQYSFYYCRKYSSKELLRLNGIDLREVSIGDESFERAFAYVQMNCVAANICLHPSVYPWGTGNCFFNPLPCRGSSVEQMSIRALSRLIHSKLPLPPGYIVNDLGVIDPRCYVPAKFVESIFRTPKRMNFFLQNSSKAKRRKELPSFSDRTVSTAMQELSASLFRAGGLSEMSDGEKSELFRQVRYRFSSDPNQIARVSGMTYEEVVRYLEMI